jgi:WD40 repeat protein
LAIYTIGKTEPEAVLELPKSQFGLLRTTALSDDGQLLAVSDRSRGAVWDLKTGNRVFHMRSFRGSFVSPDGRIFADFPKAGATPRSMAVMNVADGTVAAAGEPITDEHARQHGRYLVVRRSKKQSTETEDKNADSKPFTEEETEKRIDAKATSLEIRDVTTGARLWSREFQFETPGYFLSPTQDTMVLVWRLTGKAAMEIIRSRPELSSMIESMKDRENDYLLQVVDPQTGAIRGNFMLETGNGSFYPQGIMAAGDYLLVDDDENRLLLYSIPTGRLLQRFFGSRIAVAGTSGLIAVENVPGRVTVYDVGSGRELEKLSFAKGLAAMNFSKDGKSLFVLTRDQTYFVIDATKFTAPK